MASNDFNDVGLGELIAGEAVLKEGEGPIVFTHYDLDETLIGKHWGFDN